MSDREATLGLPPQTEAFVRGLLAEANSLRAERDMLYAANEFYGDPANWLGSTGGCSRAVLDAGNVARLASRAVARLRDARRGLPGALPAPPPPRVRLVSAPEDASPAASVP